MPKKKLSLRERIAEYRKIAFISSLGMAVFSALYIIGLHLPYFYPGKITKGEITGSISAMEFFLIPLVYQGAMALICTLSILHIALKKSFTSIILLCILICLPEYAYRFYFTFTELISTGEVFSVLGVGYYLLFIAMLGTLISMYSHTLNERLGEPTM